MPKRKFSDLNDRSSGPSDIKLARLTARFENGVTALSRALKTARAFERQKLGRREKTAKSENKPEALARIEEEIKVIKTLNFQSTAEKYLFKQLVKTKRIAESPVFLKFKERKNISTEGPRSTAEANVTARLYKSNPVKNVFPGIMDGIRQLLGLEVTPAGKKSGPEQKKGSADQRKSESKEQEPVPSLDGRSEPETASDADNRKTASKQADEGEEGSDVDMDDAESVDYSHFDARLAPGSGSDSDGESDAEEASHSDDSNNPVHYSDISRSVSRSPSPEQPTKKSKKASSSSTTTPATSTTFLPSLTMGGYFSGSESEPEDLEGAAGPPRRKNRMGQQARRALWEKKYGSGANHIKKQKDNERKNRDSGWDTRRGATDGSEGPRGKRGLGQGRGGDRFRQRDNDATGGDRPQRGPPGGFNKKNVKDDKPLHPSWEAARKAKEQKSMASFQGKKVTFD
ncbi:hypothetical protein Asppvi_008563 [Aspergillus pseudoviridinutans]|uniref:Bud22 domain-containing protein n=1 Tax=Aspergillus pseudoviridinutans TaxID=1517512 RepID=A0A9P3EY39_9EURO|nr:uncharacterized protein Asppvi_008563 [Aspergillus pseudoviridinutans]GIJ89618.1 hypothetical protein Asppvi_008563 [Aspergillus pseudoviridinutans]